MAEMTKSMESMRSWIQNMVMGTMEYLKVKERSRALVTFAKEQPVQATLIGVVLATSFLPAVVFVSFVTTFLVVGLIVLLIIEGTAIISAVGILGFALFGSLIASVFIAMFLISGLVFSRFAWRMMAPLRTMMAPLRTMMAARLGMLCKGDGYTDNKNAPEDKEQMETFSAELDYDKSD